jgi:predicted transcriptional regulator
MSSINISESLNNRLSITAKEMHQSISTIVQDAIKLYLEELEEDKKDYKDALAILEDNSPTYTLEEVAKELKLDHVLEN